MSRKIDTTEILYELRTAKGLNQKTIANVLGITQQTYSSYENGTSELPTRHLLKLSEYYGIHSDYILDHKVAAAKRVELNAPFTPEYTIGEFLGLCMTLKEADRKSVYDMAVFLSKKSS